MSRKPFSRSSAVVPAAAAAPAKSGSGGDDNAATQPVFGTQNGSADDICPVCKTIRYLNKDMVFLINPECYHPMCSNCVARLFAGPNQCPYAGCYKTLRRRDFRRAFFDDLNVEREVDIRRRVAAVFNQSEDDFETLDAYNEHLERVEALSMDLVSGAPTARRLAEAELARWEDEHRAEIERNRRRGERADEMGRARLAAERDAARSRRLEALRQDEEERESRLRAREADLDSLARAPDNDGGASAGRIMLRRRGQHRRDNLLAAEEHTLRGSALTGTAAAAAAAASTGATTDADTASATDGSRAGTPAPAHAGGQAGLTIRGLKDRRKLTAAAAAEARPYNPFEGLDAPPSRFRVLPESASPQYRNAWLQGARELTSHRVGGYNVHDYCARALFEAFSGLAVFVDDEKETGIETSAAAVATVGASLAAGGDSEAGYPARMEVDSVF